MENQFDITLDDSVALLKRVLPMMSERRVPTIPQNYAIWFEYVSHFNPELCAQLDAHMKEGLAFTPAVCQDFYERFFLARIRGEVDELRGSMQEAIECVLTQLGDLEGGMEDYGNVLDDCGTQLSDDPSPQQLKSLVSTLITVTDETRKATQEVSSTMHSMTEELTELRAQVNQLNRDSRTDALTGIANRRAFNEVINRMTNESAKNGEPLSLILVDIDHFKKFNDTHGHIFGDAVIRHVAQEMKQSVKGRDFIARYGGEEFALLLPTTPATGAMMLADSIRLIIETQGVRSEDKSNVEKVTISLGVAQYVPGETHSDFINRADAALYHSKSNGRNKVTSETELQKLH